MTSHDEQRTLVVEPTLLVRLKRPEGYEDVHPELVLEDAHIDPAFEPEIVANALPADLSLLLREAAKALARLEAWDASRNYIVPYRVRDPLRAVAALLRQRLDGSKG